MFWRLRGTGRRLESIYTVSKLINFFPIRQAVPVGLAQASFCSWAHWAGFFIEKKVYCSRYSIFTCNVVIYIRLGRREWVDALG